MICMLKSSVFGRLKKSKKKTTFRIQKTILIQIQKSMRIIIPKITTNITKFNQNRIKNISIKLTLLKQKSKRRSEYSKKSNRLLRD